MHTFADPLARAVQVAAGKTAVIDQDKTFTYSDLQQRCGKLVKGLYALGLELSLIHISEPTRRTIPSRMPSSA